ncbi:MAG: 3-isopropylmalate dehydratase small subunit [Clostridiaceae bacterium]|nr:3-isopropylmalate dehydratase small subunit [Clostridiaceae bacterium]
MRLQGHAFKYGDNVDTDVIIPARYLNTAEPAELARHCLEDLDPSFIGKVRPGDILVAGSNFGCGSSREHAPVAIKASGVSCVVARSFARIFYRNAINMGLPILESAEASAAVAAGDQLDIDLDTGRIADLTRNLVFQARPFPAFIQKIIAADGLMGTLRNKEKQE